MLESKRGEANDEGVSAVIGVILMVAITVAIAATVYIWVGGFGVGDTGGETASATASATTIDNSSDWVRVTLSSGENAPYSAGDFSVEVLDSNGSIHSTICDEPNLTGAYDASDILCTSAGEWDVGASKYIPCSWGGNHQVTLTLLGTVILDRSVSCANPSDDGT